MDLCGGASPGGDAGRIVEFKVMIRPLKAITLIRQKMAAMLQRQSLTPG
jgi:hypothetical protein